MAHAHLFYGQPGVGKDAMAIGMAMGLNCTAGTFGGCCVCDSCKKVLRYGHPAFRMVYPVPSRPKSMKEEKYADLCRETILQRIRNPYSEPDAFSEMATLPIIGIEDIAQIRRELALRLAGFRHRVFLVSHAERMTAPASNSLLKMLEEPPEGTVFFLTTSNPARVLPTIASRCQKMRFDALTESDIADALRDRWQIAPDQAAFSASLSGGSLQHALEFSAEGYREKRDQVLAFFEACVSPDREIQYEAVENLSEGRGKMELVFLFRILVILLRDLLVLRSGMPYKLLNPEQRLLLEGWIGKWPSLDAEAGIQAVQQAVERIERNGYALLVTLDLSRQLRSTVR